MGLGQFYHERSTLALANISTGSLPLPAQSLSQPARKTSTENSRQYRQRLKQNPYLYRRYREKQSLYEKRYREKKKKQC